MAQATQLPLPRGPLAIHDDLPHYGVHIDGEHRAPVSEKYFATTQPYDGKTWAMIADAGAEDVDSAVQSAWRAGNDGPWASMSASERGRLMRKLADLVAANASWLAEIERRDNGKLVTEVSGQVKYVADYLHYYAGLADKFESSVIPTDKKGVFAYTKHEPKGVVAIITPWNSPLSLTAWKLGPALAAGCTAVVKPSEFTSASMIEFAALIEAAGIPPGVVNVVTGGAKTGEALVTHDKVAHVGFTGGGEAGRKIYEMAARGLKTVTLELGGKSPNIVFDDADQDQAVKGVVAGIFAASGQTCIAGSRLLVQRSIHDAFVKRLIDFVSTAKLGDPGLEETQIGPIATPAQFDKIMSYIEIAKKEGAKCVLGGKARPDIGAGRFVEPTIFTGVDNAMRIAQEEVFGPVLSVIPFDTEEDAIRIGNDIAFGLAAGVWTTSLKRSLMMADRLKAGTIWINNYRSTSFTSPFGGYKQSGVGRESGIEAIRDYVQTKCVWISADLEVANPFGRR
ncbi:aldehyde dehydrogenase [Achromobacter aloeverae]